MEDNITPRQRDYIVSLIDTRNLMASPKWFDAVNAMDANEYAACLKHLKEVQVPALSRAKASKYIEQLLTLPKLPSNEQPKTSGPWAVEDVNTFAQMGQPSAPGDEVFAMHRLSNGSDLIVPRGSYAISKDDGELPNVFTNELLFFSVWISDDGERWTVRMYVSDERVKISRSLQYDVLDAIGTDPAAAAARYGHEIGKCGICGRKLTNDESRARGIGPICAEKWGW